MFRLAIVTPEKIFYDEDIQSLVVPGTEGYLGVLSNHAPLITALKPGRIEFRDKDDNISYLSVTNGFIEVSQNKATLLCDAAEYAADIDIDRAEKALENAKIRMKEYEKGNKEIDVQAERDAIERASNRIKIFKEKH